VCVCECVCVSVCVCVCALTCFADPLQVPVELPLDLLLPPQLQELAPVLHALSLFGELSAEQRPHVGVRVCVSVCVCVWGGGGGHAPGEHAQHQVEHEEGADDDEGDVVHPVPGAALHVVALKTLRNITPLPYDIITSSNV